MLAFRTTSGSKVIEREEPTSVNIFRLAERLNKMGMSINAEDIVQETDSELETDQSVREEIEVGNRIFEAKKSKIYDPNEPSLSAWESANIRYKMKKLGF